MKKKGDGRLVGMGVVFLVCFFWAMYLVCGVGWKVGDAWVIDPMRPGVWGFLPVVFLGFGVMCLFGVVWRRGPRRKRFGEGRCEGCGYDLRASEGRCPECGREF
jgi:hypothetical protein